MSFVQVIEFKTSRHDEVDKVTDDWFAATEGTRSPIRVLSCRDRDADGVYLHIVEFSSYEEAMANSSLPETSDFAQRLAELCDGPATFRNLDVLRDEAT